MEFYILLFAEVFHECLITVRLFAAQMEITMDSLDAIVQLLENPQKRHAVGPTAERHKMQPIRCQQRVLRDEIGYFTFHFSLLTFHST